MPPQEWYIFGEICWSVHCLASSSKSTPPWEDRYPLNLDCESPPYRSSTVAKGEGLVVEHASANVEPFNHAKWLKVNIGSAELGLKNRFPWRPWKVDPDYQIPVFHSPPATPVFELQTTNSRGYLQSVVLDWWLVWGPCFLKAQQDRAQVDLLSPSSLAPRKRFKPTGSNVTRTDLKSKKFYIQWYLGMIISSDFIHPSSATCKKTHSNFSVSSHPSHPAILVSLDLGRLSIARPATVAVLRPSRLPWLPLLDMRWERTGCTAVLMAKERQRGQKQLLHPYHLI